jgi:hypothetical protein
MRTHRLHAAVLAAIGAAVMLAGSACGGAGHSTPGSAAGTGGPGGGNVLSRPTTSPAPPITWVTACSLLTEADILAATTDQKTKVTVVDKKENNTSIGNMRISDCRYNTKGVQTDIEGGGTLESNGDCWVILEIHDRGASFEFPPKPDLERVSGIGDDAYWADPKSETLRVRKGDAVFRFESYAPTDFGADIQADRRKVTQRIAQAVMARVR